MDRVYPLDGFNGVCCRVRGINIYDEFVKVSTGRGTLLTFYERKNKELPDAFFFEVFTVVNKIELDFNPCLEHF